MATWTQQAWNWLERRPWGQHLRWIRWIGWGEALLLVMLLVLIFIGNLFIELADDVSEGETQEFDEWVVRSVRRADDPALPIGPAWLREVGIDLTALGSHVLIILIVIIVCGFLLLLRKHRLMWLAIISTVGAMILSAGLKEYFDRQRPDIVPHLREVMTPSFPSGHATLSAAVYLTLGALMMTAVKSPFAKAYCIAVAILLTVLVGLSRVYLGVHYPTDVLAGWAVGVIWALLCWIIAQFLQRWPDMKERIRTVHGAYEDPAS